MISRRSRSLRFGVFEGSHPRFPDDGRLWENIRAELRPEEAATTIDAFVLKPRSDLFDGRIASPSLPRWHRVYGDGWFLRRRSNIQNCLSSAGRRAAYGFSASEGKLAAASDETETRAVFPTEWGEIAPELPARRPSALIER